MIAKLGKVLWVQKITITTLKNGLSLNFTLPNIESAAIPNNKTIEPIQRLYQFDYAIWWGDMPQPLYTFLEEYDFGAKTIIPFITHGDSGASRTVDTISQPQPGALMMGNELVLSRNDVAESEETVVTWAKELGTIPFFVNPALCQSCFLHPFRHRKHG